MINCYMHIAFFAVKCIIFNEDEAFVYNILGHFGMARNALVEV